MGRFFLTIILAGVLAGIAAWYLGAFTQAPTDPTRPEGGGQPTIDVAELGDPLYPPAKIDKRGPRHRVAGGRDPVVLVGTLTEKDKVDLPSQVPGQILYIGEGVPEGTTQVTGVAPFLHSNYKQATVIHKERRVAKFYRPLHKDEEVVHGQMVGEIDYTRALNAVLGHMAILEKSLAEIEVSREMEMAAKELYDITVRTKSGVAAREVVESKVTLTRTSTDLVKAQREMEKEQFELYTARNILALHEIRFNLPVARGRIKTIYHDTQEAVKENDPVLQIYSTDRLLAEAFVEAQYEARLQRNMMATVEPAQDETPLRMFEGHRAHAPIANVAFVVADKELYVVSASEDGFLKMWRQEYKGAVASVNHREPIKSMAVSPPGAKQTVCATGTTDGKIHLWNLFPDKNSEPRPVALLEQPLEGHKDAVTALAFSADGAWLASGSADGTIKLWSAADGKLIYLERGAAFDDNPHQGGITALAFTPHSRLVSASRDNTLRVWNLKQKGAHLEGSPITGRSGNVNQLGVSQDGRLMLFDQGKSLQLMAAPDGQVINTLRNPGSTTPFETLALLSPDASLILTGGAPEGKLQLWRAPSDESRGFEVRQFVAEQRSHVTCAAFAPAVGAGGETAFAASGTKDGNVYLWPVPSKKDVEAHRITNVPVTLFSRNVEAGSRQIRVGVEVPNPSGRLIPGRPVTIVME